MTFVTNVIYQQNVSNRWLQPWMLCFCPQSSQKVWCGDVMVRILHSPYSPMPSMCTTSMAWWHCLAQWHYW